MRNVLIVFLSGFIFCCSSKEGIKTEDIYEIQSENDCNVASRNSYIEMMCYYSWDGTAGILSCDLKGGLEAKDVKHQVHFNEKINELCIVKNELTNRALTNFNQHQMLEQRCLKIDNCKSLISFSIGMIKGGNV